MSHVLTDLSLRADEDADTTQPAARVRLIIIDDSREYMVLLRRMLASTMPDIEVTEYDAEQQGKPGPGFDWSLYDAVLLDGHLGDGRQGLEWLTEFAARPGFPPAVFMTHDGNEYLAARAIKAGAFDYVRKQDINAERIGRLIAGAVGQRDGVNDDTVPQAQPPSPHLAILERIAARQLAQTAPGRQEIGYRFVRLIGQGASSRVYLAERADDDTTLVLKIINAQTVRDAQAVERFIREADLVSSIDSPHVVRFFDHGVTQTYGYIAMEFFTRGDLKQRLEIGISETDAVNYLRHIALGLEAVHDAGIIHRDLKPGNIMFRADDSLALADFGISKRIGAPSDLTNEGCVLGTPNYLSPEQALGEPLDIRTDLYSAGIVFYEMLTGRKPFVAENASALVYQHVHAPIPRLPAELHRYQAVIDCLLAKRPERRIPTAGDLLAVIARL